jgi:pyruvate, water dikinase
MNIFSGITKKFRRKMALKQEDETFKQSFQDKYSIFQKLLSANNKVLELIADMEEKLSGEFLFDRHYIDEYISAISVGVGEIIDRMNEISKNKYSELHERFAIINSEIEKLLIGRKEIPESGYIIPFHDIERNMADRLGGKNANLGEVRNRLGLLTPDGFAVSAFAFKRFMEHNGFMQKINDMLSGIEVNSIEELNKGSKGIQDTVAGGEIPADLRNAIHEAVEKLKLKEGGQDLKVSVRSSALQEDGEFSFAGQYSTFLNVHYEEVPEKYKEVIASLFTERAIFYFKTKGFQDYDMVMSVGILKMINAKAGGVLYTRDPNRDVDDILVSAVHGLGICVVDGTITPETYAVSRQPVLKIISKNVPQLKKMFVCRIDGGVQEMSVTHDTSEHPCLTDAQILTLAEHALAIENHYQCPQDIEWALDENNKLFILQTRPLRIIKKGTPKPIPTHVAGYSILIDRGVIACKGIGYGSVHIVKTDDDLNNFPDNAVLVARHTSPMYVTVMNKASAIITDFGGITGHMASLAREFQVPAILDTEVATKTLQPGQEITVDAFNCSVYEGKVNELIELSGKRDEPFKDTLIFKTLKNVLKLVVPLNLYDPAGENFKPEFCATFHDITRFCHEMAMYEMFRISDAATDEIGETKKLVSGIPLVIYVIDLGSGLSANSPKTLNPSHISSIPLNAIFRGLAAMKWPQGSPSVDAKGFLGMMAHTASIPEDELRKTGEKSFSFISLEYMNFTLRLGYHLSTIEAYAGDNLNDNYIRFFFKGGGAALDRRLRRVRLISEILKSMDFSVKVVEDVIDANISKYRKNMIEEKLETLGRLTVYTKQLDMVMYNDAITDLYIDEFIKQYVSKT